MKLVRVSEVKKMGIPIAPSTLYKWNHLKKYPIIFRKLGGFLFVDLDEMERIIEQSRER
jgi:hypothetical protein